MREAEVAGSRGLVEQNHATSGVQCRVPPLTLPVASSGPQVSPSQTEVRSGDWAQAACHAPASPHGAETGLGDSGRETGEQ